MVLSNLFVAVQPELIELRRVYAAHYSNTVVFNLCERMEEKWRNNGRCCLYFYNSADFR